MFRGLADANRLRIVSLLLEGERCGCELQASLGLTQSNVSRHLNYLRSSGLVTDERRGQRIYYRISEKLRQEFTPLLKFLRTALDGPKQRRALSQAAVRHRRARRALREQV
ncbi:MAG: ArsR/SmtB family transcription factor [Bryobacteraceae bacterium]